MPTMYLFKQPYNSIFQILAIMYWHWHDLLILETIIQVAKCAHGLEVILDKLVEI